MITILLTWQDYLSVYSIISSIFNNNIYIYYCAHNYFVIVLYRVRRPITTPQPPYICLFKIHVYYSYIKCIMLSYCIQFGYILRAFTRIYNKPLALTFPCHAK